MHFRVLAALFGNCWAHICDASHISNKWCTSSLSTTTTTPRIAVPPLHLAATTEICPQPHWDNYGRPQHDRQCVHAMSAHERVPRRWMQRCSMLLTAMRQQEWQTRNVHHFCYSLVSALIILLWFLSWIPSAPPASMLDNLPHPTTHHQDLAMTVMTPCLPQPTTRGTTSDVVIPQWHLATQQKRGVSPRLIYWWSRLES